MDVETMHKRIGTRTAALCAALLLLLLVGTTARAALLNEGFTLNPAPQVVAQPSPGATQVAQISIPFAAATVPHPPARYLAQPVESITACRLRNLHVRFPPA